MTSRVADKRWSLILEKELTPKAFWYNNVVWSPSGTHLAATNSNATIYVWHTHTGNLTQTIETEASLVQSLCWSPDGEKMAYVTDDDVFVVVDPFEGKRSQSFRIDSMSDKGAKEILWLPTHETLICISNTDLIYFIDLTSNKIAQQLSLKLGRATCMSLSRNNQYLAVGNQIGTIQLWDLQNTDFTRLLSSHSGEITCISWSPEGRYLASASMDYHIKIWAAIPAKLIGELEGHTDIITSLAYSPDGHLIVSKSNDSTVRLWNPEDLNLEFRTNESVSSEVDGKIGFHPYQMKFATTGTDSKPINIWKIQETQLSQEEYIRYASAKVVLVGDGGTGKTTLGTRLKYKRFENHEPTHGQHFWQLDELAKTRNDGTQCEVMLWDFAGQKNYRLLNTLFLQDTKLALITCDLTREDEAMNGVGYWINALKNNQGKYICNIILTGTKSDKRYKHPLTRDLRSFCRKLKISGEYIETSANTRKGIPELKKKIESEIDWDSLVPIGTSPALKVAKEYVLQLKENRESEREQDDIPILITLNELRARLTIVYPEAKLTSQDLLNAIEDLERLGFIRIIRSITGKESNDLLTILQRQFGYADKDIIKALNPENELEFNDLKDNLFDIRYSRDEIDVAFNLHNQNLNRLKIDLVRLGYGSFQQDELALESPSIYVLLAPELFNNLAASFISEASRHQEGLGSLDERKLRQCEYDFPEFEKLGILEKIILTDAVVSHLLQNDVCFREIYQENTFFVFPECIRREKPIELIFNFIEDCYYIITGTIELVYSVLVVNISREEFVLDKQLYETITLFEVENELFCGLRVIKHGEGIIEVLLFYSRELCTRKEFESIRKLFEGKFESSLHRYNIQYERYPVITCSNKNCNHYRQNFSEVIKRYNENKQHICCSECGERLSLPDISSLAEFSFTKYENEGTIRRKAYEQALSNLKSYMLQQYDNVLEPECFISYAWGNQEHERWVENSLASDLRKADIKVILDRWCIDKFGKNIKRFISKIDRCKYVIVVGTPLYREKYENKREDRGYVVASEVDLIENRLIGSEARKESVIPILLDGDEESSLPPLLHGITYANFQDNSMYYEMLFTLICTLHEIPEEDIRRIKIQMIDDVELNLNSLNN